MATNTLIQKLFASDESGVGEDSIKVSNRQELETFFASEAIADGDLVCLDISKTSDGDKMSYVKKLKTDAGLTAVAIGIADQAAIEAGDQIRVVIKGFKANANVATGAAVGERIVGTATAGRGDVLANSSTLPALAYVITEAAANVADVMVIKQF
mgnify:CR=1 FL=1|tara:strand:+ start:2176 stop:2640 length:465 start_codon:yes stop_codon:yes gene_type:complete